MRNWFYRPGTAIIGFVARLLWGARVESGDEHIPRSGPFILVANHCSNVDPLILGWAVGNRTNRLIHFMAKAEMLALAGPRLAGDAVGRLLRAPRRGRPRRPALRARGAGRSAARSPSTRRARARATVASRPASPARPAWPCARARRCCRPGSRARIGSSRAARASRIRPGSSSASASRSRFRTCPMAGSTARPLPRAPSGSWRIEELLPAEQRRAPSSDDISVVI